MDVREIRYRPDWPSRVLAIFSLIMAGIAVGYVVLQGQLEFTQQALEKQFNQRLQDHLAQRQPEWNALISDLRTSTDAIKVATAQDIQQFLTAQESQIDQAVTQALHDQQGSYDTLATQHDRRLQALERQMGRLELARPNVPDAEGAPANGTVANRTATAQEAQRPDGSAGGNGAVGSSSAADQQATQTGATNSAKTIDVQPTEYDAQFRVENLGQEPASIDRLRFVPTSYAAVNRLTLGPAPESVQQYVFAKTDNSSEASGEHGVYEMSLSAPLRVGANQSVTARLAIDNSVHDGWALIGDLILYQGDREVGRVERIAGPFVQR
jgi:hypothetical protein